MSTWPLKNSFTEAPKQHHLNVWTRENGVVFLFFFKSKIVIKTVASEGAKQGPDHPAYQYTSDRIDRSRYFMRTMREEKSVKKSRKLNEVKVF